MATQSLTATLPRWIFFHSFYINFKHLFIMAKSVGIIGTVIGKLGNAVGYRIKDSNNKMTQGFRVYQPNVTNPRTYAQAVQRARMKPINTFYRALKSIIDRGFEGKSYGNQCRLEFLRLAMANFNGPYVHKGFNGLLPGPFTISNGSLQTISATLSMNGPQAVLSDLKMTLDLPFTNVGDASQMLLDNNKFLREGDQITFVGISATNNHANVEVKSLVIDTSSTESVTGFASVTNNNITVIAMLCDDPIAGAVILSREGNNGQHLRSKAVMTVADSIVNTYFTEDAQAAAVFSYMSADGTTDWPEVKISSADIAQLVSIEVNTDMTAATVPAGTQALGFVTRTGESGVFFITSGENKVLVKTDGTKLTATAEGSTTDVTLKADYDGLTLEYSSAYGRL